MSVAPATNRVDTEALAAALAAAGWHQDESQFFDMSRVWRNGMRGITLTSDGPFIWTERLLEPFGPVGVLDPVWQHVIDLIRQHTTPAPTVREQPAQDPTYLLAVIEHSAQLEERGEINDRQRQYWSECRAALLRQTGRHAGAVMDGDTGGQG